MTLAPLAALLVAAAGGEVTPAQARPGDAVLVTVRGAGGPPSGALLGRRLHFFAAGPDRWEALAPLPTEAAPGVHPLALEADGEPVDAALEVLPAGFRETTLSVPPRFLEPPPSARKRIAADNAALAEAYGQPFAPPRWRGAMRRPRDAGATGRYGDQRVYNGRVSGAHYGLDLAGPAGAPIAASAAGQVVLARDCYMSGWTTVVWHGADTYSVYLHQSRVEVKEGQAVERGQRIGRVGSTGRSTGPHLHWGIKVDGLWVDPDSLVRLEVELEPAVEPERPAALDATDAPRDGGAAP